MELVTMNDSSSQIVDEVPENISEQVPPIATVEKNSSECRKRDQSQMTSDNPPPPVTFITTICGFKKAVCLGYLYVKKRTLRKGVEIYECEKRRGSKQCNATIHIQGDQVVRQPREHTHEPDFGRVEALSFRESVKRRCLATNETASKIIDDVLSNLSEQALARTAQIPSLKQFIYHHRRRNQSTSQIVNEHSEDSTELDAVKTKDSTCNSIEQLLLSTNEDDSQQASEVSDNSIEQINKTEALNFAQYIEQLFLSADESDPQMTDDVSEDITQKIDKTEALNFAHHIKQLFLPMNDSSSQIVDEVPENISEQVIIESEVRNSDPSIEKPLLFTNDSSSQIVDEVPENISEQVPPIATVEKNSSECRKRDQSQMTSDNPPPPVTFITTICGFKKAVCLGYLYVKKRTLRKGVEIYECEKRRGSKQCNATIHIQGDQVVRQPREHTHEPDFGRVEALCFRESVKRRCLATNETASKIIDDVLSNLSEQALARTAQIPSLKQFIYHHRRRNQSTSQIVNEHSEDSTELDAVKTKDSTCNSIEQLLLSTNEDDSQQASEVSDNSIEQINKTEALNFAQYIEQLFLSADESDPQMTDDVSEDITQKIDKTEALNFAHHIKQLFLPMNDSSSQIVDEVPENISEQVVIESEVRNPDPSIEKPLLFTNDSSSQIVDEVPENISEQVIIESEVRNSDPSIEKPLLFTNDSSSQIVDEVPENISEQVPPIATVEKNSSECRKKDQSQMTSDNPPPPVEFITTLRGFKKAVCLGYLYVKKRTLRKGVEIYECEKRRGSKQCNATIHIQGDQVVRQPREHTHEPDFGRVEALSFRESVKRRCLATNETASEIIEGASANLSEQAAVLLPSKNTIENYIKHQRSKASLPPTQVPSTNIVVSNQRAFETLQNISNFDQMLEYINSDDDESQENQEVANNSLFACTIHNPTAVAFSTELPLERVMHAIVAKPKGPVPEWTIIELQGELSSTDKALLSLDNKYIGDLHLNSSNKKEAVFIIGHHLLTGRLVKLDKPYLVTHKSPDKGQEVIRHEVVAVVRQRLLFKTRPKPIILPQDLLSSPGSVVK